MLAGLETAESAEPERPAGVPALGTWDPSIGKWEVAQHDAHGVRDGECLRYRPDGTLFSRSWFVAGIEDGRFEIFHLDGQLAREGRFAAGRLDGVVSAYAPVDPTKGEPLRNCCVPPKATRLDIRYRQGDYLVETFYDGEGRALLSDGRLCPARPAGLPELAVFDEGREGWTMRSQNLDRFWTVEGALREEVENEPDGGRRVRLLDDAGVVAQDLGFGPGDQRRGRFLHRLSPDAPVPYADARVREVHGGFERGQAVGEWAFLDAGGDVLRAVDLGRALDADVLESSPAFGDDRPDWPLAHRLAGQGRVREALVAAARAARAGDRDALKGFVAEHTVSLTAEGEAERGDALARAGDVDLAGVLDALVLGADAAAAFRALASVLPGTRRAAPDVLEASLLLAPERHMTHLTRALIRIQRGDEPGARADLAVLEGHSEGSGESLLEYIGAVFRPFEFSPPSDMRGAEAPPEGVSVAIAQDLDAVRHLAGIYATRIGRVRDALRALTNDGGDQAEAADWMPPDLTALLPDGPVALRCETLECEPAADDDGNPATIDVDETVALAGLAAPMLLSLAHADYVALGWLCWAVGLDAVSLPDAINGRTDLAAAMQMVVKRQWRTRDRLTTGGLLAMSHGVPGFTWRGLELDAMPAHIIEIVAAEYLAARSMFLWLASPDTLTPFQDDIQSA
jgi:hypothetical protein